MITRGDPPYLEASTVGDSRFSAFNARILKRNLNSIEEIYQAAKIFEDGSTNLDWRKAKGKKAINQTEISALYIQLWREYLIENSYLMDVLVKATGISDRFGQTGHNCQAVVLWQLRMEYLAKNTQT